MIIYIFTQNKRVFLVCGPYNQIRGVLRHRGWVEKYFQPRPKQKHNGDSDDSDDSNDDVIAEREERKRKEEERKKRAGQQLYS